jgi:hypothetical protein
MTTPMSGPLSFMTIGFGTTSKPIGTSQSSRIERIPSLHSCMLVGLICSKSMIKCSTRSSPRLRHLASLIYLACIRTGTQSWSLSSIPLLGEVEMRMSPLSTLALKATDSVFVSRSFPLSSDCLPMICVGLKLSLRGQ